MRFVRILVAALSLFCFGKPASVPAAPSPSDPLKEIGHVRSEHVIRHLVYNFNSNIGVHVVHDSAAMDNSGTPTSLAPMTTTDSWESMGDTGTVTVDVIGLPPDTSLVVHISQDGSERSTKPITCVVYGTTLVLCDPNPSNTLHEEEVALLRVLGRNFVDPRRIDAGGGWHVGWEGNNLSDDAHFRVTANDGGMLQIAENRVVTTHGLYAFLDPIDGTITYDLHKTVPTKIDETITSRVQRAIGLYATDTFRISLSLVSDSMTRTSNQPTKPH